MLEFIVIKCSSEKVIIASHKHKYVNQNENNQIFIARIWKNVQVEPKHTNSI